jgi:hypothetical protein
VLDAQHKGIGRSAEKIFRLKFISAISGFFTKT